MATNDPTSRVSNYLEYLPAILQADPFVGQLLLAFEGVLSGLSPKQTPEGFPKGLEQYIDGIPTYFTPGLKQGEDTAPSEFLSWLAGWVALSLRDEWSDETKRQFISAIVPLYRWRGTKVGLEKILEVYLESSNLPKKVEVFEFDDPPYYFQVQLTLPDPDPEKYWRQARIAKAIIDLEKPAHTYYGLKILVPTMRLTGNVYPISLNKPGEITATVQPIDSSNSLLRLCIKANLGQAEPNEQDIGKNKLLKLTYVVTQAQLDLNKLCYIIVDNLSDSLVKVVIKVMESNNEKSILQDKHEELVPGLRIIKKKYEKPLNGNTILGTESGKIIEANKVR